MPEAIISPEIATSLPVEALEETQARMLHIPHVIAGIGEASAIELTDTTVAIQGVPATLTETFHWGICYGGVKANQKPIDFSEPTTQRAALHGLADINPLVNDAIISQARWWDTDGIHNLREDVQKNLIETFRFEKGKVGVDLVNLSGEKLTEDEQRKIQDTLVRVDNYTDGRALSDFSAIVLRKEDKFEDGFVGGYYQAKDGIITINMDNMREENDVASPRYKRYFPDTSASKLQVILAHEIGHSIDEQDSLLTGAERSHFIDRFGWEGVEKPFDKRPNGECPEIIDPITDYGTTNPSEDFAETFAILAMGGDATQLPNRAQAMREYIAGLPPASGTEASIEMVRSKSLEAKIPSRVVYRAYEPSK